MAALVPRVVVVTRPTEFALLVAEHGTRDQARFALGEEGRSIDVLIELDRLQHEAVTAILGALPLGWRRARIERDDLATFAFDPDDVVVTIGQDGLVPNVAKYLADQVVVGVNPDPANYSGVLVKHAPRAAVQIVERAVSGRADFESRTMAEMRLDDGQRLRALNEIFVGHRSHQSARYRLHAAGRDERQSSSGLIVATGTGATGWARSIAGERRTTLAMPAPGDASLALYVREAFPAPGFGVELTAATVDAAMPATIVSEMTSGGVIFGDGIEDDFIRFGFGRRAEIGIAERPLRLAA